MADCWARISIFICSSINGHLDCFFLPAATFKKLTRNTHSKWQTWSVEATSVRTSLYRDRGVECFPHSRIFLPTFPITTPPSCGGNHYCDLYNRRCLVPVHELMKWSNSKSSLASGSFHITSCLPHWFTPPCGSFPVPGLSLFLQKPILRMSHRVFMLPLVDGDGCVVPRTSVPVSLCILC